MSTQILSGHGTLDYGQGKKALDVEYHVEYVREIIDTRTSGVRFELGPESGSGWIVEPGSVPAGEAVLRLKDGKSVKVLLSDDATFIVSGDPF